VGSDRPGGSFVNQIRMIEPCPKDLLNHGEIISSEVLLTVGRFTAITGSPSGARIIFGNYNYPHFSFQLIRFSGDPPFFPPMEAETTHFLFFSQNGLSSCFTYLISMEGFGIKVLAGWAFFSRQPWGAKGLRYVKRRIQVKEKLHCWSAPAILLKK